MLALAKLSCFSLTCTNSPELIKKGTDAYLKQVRMNVDLCLINLENKPH